MISFRITGGTNIYSYTHTFTYLHIYYDRHKQSTLGMAHKNSGKLRSMEYWDWREKLFTVESTKYFVLYVLYA